MNARWRKIVGDLRAHRLQVALIAAVLAIGAAGVIAGLNARVILQREIARSFESAHSPDIALWFDKVDAALLAKVRAQPGVAAVDSRGVVFTRIASEDGRWFLARLSIARDFDDQRLATVHQHSGSWKAADDGIFIEQSGRELLGVKTGAHLRLRTPTGEIATLYVAGFVHDTAVAPSAQERAIYGYITPAAAEHIGQNPELDQLLVKIANRGDMSDTTAFANDLRDWLKSHGENPLRAEALSDMHPHASLMDTMLNVLKAFTAIAFTCSAALALYMVSVWMKGEVREVGVMKTLGARSHQLAAQYLGLLAPVVFVANAFGLPLGMICARRLVRYYAHIFNIDITRWSAPTSLRREELLFTLLLPLAAMAIPIIRASCMTARRAIQDPGIVAPGRGRLSLSRWLRIPRNLRWTFALRNSFRRPGRLIITLVALSTGGALLLTANNTYESLMRVVDVSLGDQGHDIQVQLQQPASSAQIASAIAKVAEIETSEAWRVANVTIGNKSSYAAFLSYPPDTRLFKLPLKEGRLPRADESDAVVINRSVQGVPVGDVVVQFRNQRARLRVVGVVEEIGGATIYAPHATFESLTALGDASSLLRVKAKTGAQDAVAASLDQALLDAHLGPRHVQTRNEVRESLEQHFAVVTSVMRMVALAAALLGAISLGASAALNILERVREIGVVRALGATPQAVRAMFLMESGTVAVMSALISVALAVVFSRTMSGMAERDLLHVAVPLKISISGMATLFGGLAVVIGAVWLLLRRRLRISVRDALAYE